MSGRLGWASVILVGCLLPRAASGVLVSGDPGLGLVTAGEPIYGLNHDGVGALQMILSGSVLEQDELFATCTGSLIADRYVLTAAHCLDLDQDGDPSDFFSKDVSWLGEGGRIRLEMRFDAPGGPVAVPVTSHVSVPDDWRATWRDAAVLELASNAPAELPRYPLYGGSDEVGSDFVIVGYGGTGSGSTGWGDGVPTGDKRAARNRFDVPADWLDASLPGLIDDPESTDPPPGAALVFDFDSGLEENNTLAIWGFDSDLGFGEEEGNSGPGDSGGPLFLDGAIAGVLSGGAPAATGADATDEWDGSWGEISVGTRISSLREFFAQETDGQASFLFPPLTADFNGDARVDLADFVVLKYHFGAADVAHVDGDANEDGVVDLVDFSLLKEQFGQSTAVPEPTSLALAAVGLLAIAASGMPDGIGLRAAPHGVHTPTKPASANCSKSLEWRRT